MLRPIALSISIFVTGSVFAQAINESFDVSIGGPTTNGQAAGARLEADGWHLENKSNALGATDWFNGNNLTFSPQAGAGYVAANYDNTGPTGTISNWMILPTRLLKNGDQLRFWTRTPLNSPFADRLQVRMSVNGASVNLGASATSVGDFTQLLLDINPTYLVGPTFPQSWTQYTITISSVPTPTSGRIAFRYFVENGGGSGTRSNYIGIDSVQFTPAPLTVNVFPTSYTVVQGFLFGAGSLSTLLNSDNIRLLILNDSNNTVGEVHYHSTLPVGTLSELRFRFEGNATRKDLTQFVDLFDYALNDFENFDVRLTTQIDAVVNVAVTTNLANYFDGSRNVRSRLVYIPNQDLLSGDGWTEGADQVYWTMVP